MFAVIKTGGKQYRVQEGDILEVEKLDRDEGQKVVFDEVLLIEDGDKVLLGTPLIERARVKAQVVENFRDEKIIIFKKKRRKQYRRKKGHRQELTRVKIEEIIADMKVSPKKTTAKKIEEKKTPKKPRVKKKQAPKKEAKQTPKKPAAREKAAAEERKTEASQKPKKQSVTKNAPPPKKTAKSKEK